ncbi:MAG: amphi-Trp domain-containing protein [Nitrospirae bacterium]|nr:amphi-Trp domain-containing protein [Nitrospirota bacterium]
MKLEKRKRLSREEFAELLSDFVKMIAEEKRIVFEDMDVSMPDSFEVELEYKEKHGYAKFEIELCWDTGKTEGGHWGLMSALKNITKSSNTSIPDNFKEIKKCIEKKLEDIANLIKKGGKPSEEDIDYFKDLISAFRQQSKPEWEDGMYKLQTAVDGMIDAIHDANFSLALDRIREINNIKKDCHRVFK